MNLYEFPIPTNIDGELIKAALNGADVYIRGDKLVIGTESELTREQVAAGVEAGRTAFVVKKAEEDAIKAQEALDKASGEAKLLAVGLTKAEIKAIRKDK